VSQFTSANAAPAVSFVEFRISFAAVERHGSYSQTSLSRSQPLGQAREVRTADWPSGEPWADHTEVIV
jgi:hypothetical protein